MKNSCRILTDDQVEGSSWELEDIFRSARDVVRLRYRDGGRLLQRYATDNLTRPTRIIGPELHQPRGDAPSGAGENKFFYRLDKNHFHLTLLSTSERITVHNPWWSRTRCGEVVEAKFTIWNLRWLETVDFLSIPSAGIWPPLNISSGFTFTFSSENRRSEYLILRFLEASLFWRSVGLVASHT